MRLLANENFPLQSAHILKDAGFFAFTGRGS